MNCDDVQEHLLESLEVGLDPERQRAVEDHLASCPRCRADAAATTEGIEEVGRLPEVEPPPGFSQRVMTRVREEAATPTLWERLFRPLKIKIPLHATALLLVVGLAVFLYRMNGSSQREEAQSILPASPPAIKQSVPSPPPPPAPESAAPHLQMNSPEGAAPALSPTEPPEQRSADARLTSPGTIGPPEPSRREDLAAAAPRNLAKSKDSFSDFSASAGAPRSEFDMPPLEDRSPDVTLALSLSGKKGAEVRERIQQAGGRILPAMKTDETVRFDLPAAQYDRFKEEIAKLGKIVSESQPSSSQPSSRVPGERIRSGERLQIKLVLLPENSPENSNELGSAGASLPPPK